MNSYTLLTIPSPMSTEDVSSFFAVKNNEVIVIFLTLYAHVGVFPQVRYLEVDFLGQRVPV